MTDSGAMSRGAGRLGRGARRPGRATHDLRLPREHGFWVMLSAVVLSGLLRAEGSLAVVLAALGLSIGAVASAMWLERTVRRSGTAQVISAAMLGTLSLPLDLVAHRSVAAASFTASAWVAIFAASALIVRAMFARASTKHRRAASPIALAAVGLPMLTAITSSLWDKWPELVSASLGSAAMVVLWLLRPTVKHLKGVGIALAMLHGAYAVILARAW